MRYLKVLVLALFIASPVFGQGLTLTLSETDSTGKKSQPLLQTDKTHARLDLSNGTKLLYNAESKLLQVLLPGAPAYTELTPQLIQILAASAGQGRPSLTPIAYRRAGAGKVGQWTCSVYEGLRGTEKVAEVCAAENPAIALAVADFAIVQQAVNSVKGAVPPDVLDAVPIYGTVESQGFAGFPVRRTIFQDGKTVSTIELSEVRRGAIPSSNFLPTAVVPAGGAR